MKLNRNLRLINKKLKGGRNQKREKVPIDEKLNKNLEKKVKSKNR